jgi:hypothetical protein
VNPVRTTATEEPISLVHVRADMNDAYEDMMCDVPIDMDDWEGGGSPATVRTFTHRCSRKRGLISSHSTKQSRRVILQRQGRNDVERSAMLDAPKRERMIPAYLPVDSSTSSAMTSTIATAPLRT